MRTASSLIFAAAIAVGCGGKRASNAAEPTPATASTSEVEPPPLTEIELRRDAACEALAPKLTACAIDDARRNLPPEKLAELDPDKLAKKHSEEFLAGCKRQALSSRQVRVYEVCAREESECDALVSCLDNARPAPAEPG